MIVPKKNRCRFVRGLIDGVEDRGVGCRIVLVIGGRSEVDRRGQFE